MLCRNFSSVCFEDSYPITARFSITNVFLTLVKGFVYDAFFFFKLEFCFLCRNHKHLALLLTVWSTGLNQVYLKISVCNYFDNF